MALIREFLGRGPSGPKADSDRSVSLLEAIIGLSQGLEPGQAQTAAFATWMIGNIVLAAHMRAERIPLTSTLFTNGNYLIWAAATILILVAGLTVPFVQDRLHLSSLPPSMWLVLIPAALLIPSWWEPWKRLHRRRQRTRYA